jgi:hypothetical protein
MCMSLWVGVPAVGGSLRAACAAMCAQNESPSGGYDMRDGAVGYPTSSVRIRASPS